ncbi:hypothetical protein HMPREF1049_0113 [Fusobacterium necrophorum subsp. funduliforme ATCC 51357]|uniref:hypothetical protein n=1 Tax=Fusobacterium necrophorum TaxID=859 RepID=UPI00025E5A82|nr:hypothetical protein [Fusobacterium necrophorum]EIJ71936.1 hypothetical protein HMPREF1049_0113 [Fusobacterium necrophorum subsp. funduliforme ATCC 51357]
MAIVKIVKRDCPYVTIDKQGIDDSTLSWEATGLLTYLIGRPSNWKINITHLSSVKTNGERSTRRALLELREHNYCHYFEIRKKGRVTETIYLVFEVPTDYEEVMKSYVDLQEGEQLYYKEVKIDNSPKVRNEVSVENNEKSTFSPKVRNAKPENAKGENEALINIDSNNNRENKKRNHDHEEHDLELDFEKIFHELGVNYTKMNQESIERLLQKMKPYEVEHYIRELYKNIKENPDVKNVNALFSAKIQRQECQINTVKKEELKKIETIENHKKNYTKEEIRKELQKYNILEQKNLFKKVKEKFSKTTTQEEAEFMFNYIGDNILNSASLTHLRRQWIEVLFPSEGGKL